MSNPLKDAAAKGMNVVHRTLLGISGGRIGGKVGGMPAVKLTTTGRRSGTPRTVMLTSPVRHGDDIVLVASYGGDDDHPAWYVNLRENPTVTIEMEGKTFTAEARTASDDEKAELWPRITGAYRGYAAYQKRTDREIPVVLCTPA